MSKPDCKYAAKCPRFNADLCGADKKEVAEYAEKKAKEKKHV